MADESNPRVAVSVTGGAAEGGGLVGVQGLLTLFPVLSLVLQQPSSLVLTSPQIKVMTNTPQIPHMVKA